MGHCSEKLDVEDHYVAWSQTHDQPQHAYGTDGPFSFCSYPFLLNPRAKSKLLHTEARFLMTQVCSGPDFSSGACRKDCGHGTECLLKRRRRADSVQARLLLVGRLWGAVLCPDAKLAVINVLLKRISAVALGVTGKFAFDSSACAFRQ